MQKKATPKKSSPVTATQSVQPVQPMPEKKYRLTAAEREEIQDRLRQSRNAAIASVNASDPGWKNRVEERKRKVAIGKLKIERELLEIDKIDNQIRDLIQKKEEIEVQMKKKLPLNDRLPGYGCPTRKSACDAITEICQEIHEQVMSQDPAGKLVASENEKCRLALLKLTTCVSREDVVAAGIL